MIEEMHMNINPITKINKGHYCWSLSGLITIGILIIVGLIIISEIYVGNKLDQRANMLAGFASAFAGVLLSVPIALKINRLHEETIKDDENKSRKIAQLDRQARILQIIHEEVSSNLKSIAKWKEIVIEQKKVEARGLSKSFWDLLNNTGDFAYGSDFKLLSVLIKLYDVISSFNKLADTLFNCNTYPGMIQGTKDGKNMLQVIRNNIYKRMKVLLPELEYVHIEFRKVLEVLIDKYSKESVK